MSAAHSLAHRAPKVIAARADGHVHYVPMANGVGINSPKAASLCGRVRDENDPKARWQPLRVLADSAKVCNACHAEASRKLVVIFLPPKQ